jgi:hypothetical protein
MAKSYLYLIGYIETNGAYIDFFYKPCCVSTLLREYTNFL